MSDVNHWDGVKPLVPGTVVKYTGSKSSDFYLLPDKGTLLTLIAEDIQMGFNPVWICRWYDDAGRVNLVPLLAKVFARAVEPIDPRTLKVADNYYELTGLNLDLNCLQKSIDFLLPPVDNEPVLDTKVKLEFIEVTLLTHGGCAVLSDVCFPVTLRLTESEYKLYPELEGITILGEILNMIPGVDKIHQCDDDKFYLFYIDEDIIYKE